MFKIKIEREVPGKNEGVFPAYESVYEQMLEKLNVPGLVRFINSEGSE